MAKSQGREFVWLQCGETGDMNYRVSINTRGGVPEAIREGVRKYSPRLRRHTVHKIKRK
ncbi:MAG: 50S ribosomal protein L33 [Planctomycetales bacterium 71-10]|nr:MAG: 50S ribosomal protein L33 [Planctomycetales bacterium 71-10]